MHELGITLETLRERALARCAPFAPPPKVALPRLGVAERRMLYEQGGGDFEVLEGTLVRSARVQGAIDLAIAEGFLALSERGDGFLEVGLRRGDYAREVLDLQPSTVKKRVRLARQLRTRPMLRLMVRTGRVSLRAAEVVAPVAKGDGEAFWVARAFKETVRGLEQLVRKERAAEVEDEAERFGRLTAYASEEELGVIDEALEVAGQQLPGSTRFEQLEAMAQEWLGGHPEVVPETDDRPLSVYRGSGSREAELAEEKAQLEEETERWRCLDRIARWAATDLCWDEIATAEEIDATLRLLAEYRAAWDDRVGWAAYEISRSGLLRDMGFASFRHYIEERLGQPPKAIEQRARLERQLRRSPALREAKEAKVSYERLRLLAYLTEKEILEWIPRARDVTVVALRDELEAREARQMRARRQMSAVMPERVARLVSTAIRGVRKLSDRWLSSGECLAVIARHFLDTHGPPVKPKTSSQKVRARDHWRCSVPGCHHHAVHSHHIEYRSQGGDKTDPANQLALCAFHHTCIHKGYLKLTGSAPGGLVWMFRGVPWGLPGWGWATVA